MTENLNPIGLQGIEFVEFSGPDSKKLQTLFREFGFSHLADLQGAKVEYWNQNDIHFLINTNPGSFAQSFQKDHGPCISAMGWRVKNAKHALKIALERGAKRADHVDYKKNGAPLEAIYGIGDSLIYFIETDADGKSVYEILGFKAVKNPEINQSKGFLVIDHLTNNVPQGTMLDWANFYKKIFGFTEVRYFDIRGVKTGLTSYALRSPCGLFCIPINEGSEEKSQINEYLREYRGPGVQHLAFLTSDIVASLESMKGTGIETLNIDDQYYEEVFERVPNVTEDHAKLKQLKILVDGDDEGYLLQIFTKNIIGPIFIEIIQRKNHLAFGEGNFGALFRSIERDQEERGVI